MRRLLALGAAALALAGAATAANFLLTKSGETSSTITLAYPKQAGADGYRYYAPGTASGDTCVGTRLSRTLDPTRTSVKFAKVPSGDYCVEAIVLVPVGAGQYSTAAPSPACSNGRDDDGDGKIDLADPGCANAADDDETDPPLPPPAGLANWWVDPNGGNCVRTSSPDVYNDGNACQNPMDVYAQASVGDIVRIRAGTYAGGSFVYRPALDNLSPGCDPYGEWGVASTANCVRFIPDGGTVVFTAQVRISGSNLWLNGAATGKAPDFPSRTYGFLVDQDGGTFANVDSFGDLAVFSGAEPQRADHIIIEGVHSRSFRFNGPTNVLYRDSAAGPNRAQRVGSGGCNPAGDENMLNQLSPGNPAAFLTFDRVYVYDQDQYDPTGQNLCHSGGLLVNGDADNVTIRNSGFSNNVVYHIQFDAFGATTSNWTIENNWFGCVTGTRQAGQFGKCQNGRVFDISNPVSNLLVRFNSMWDVPTLDSGISATGSFVGNIAMNPGGDPLCSAFTKKWNLWLANRNGTGDGQCGDPSSASNLNPTAIWVAPGTTVNPDYHLLNGTNIANNRVTDTAAPYDLAFDFDGQARPQNGSTRDVGADERG